MTRIGYGRGVCIGGPDSFLCMGIRRTAPYSDRTPVHWHIWFNIGSIGFGWERPRWNR